MNSLLDLADMVSDFTDAVQNEYVPNPHTRSYARYMWYCRRTDSLRAHENYCRYWRVAWIYAPLHKYGGWIVLTPFAMAFGGLVAPYATMPVTISLIAAFVVYMVYSFTVSMQLAAEVTDNAAFVFSDLLDDMPLWVKIVAAIPAAPVVLITGLIASPFLLEEHFKTLTKTWHFLVHMHFGTRRPLAWLRPWLVVLVGVVALNAWIYHFILVNVLTVWIVAMILLTRITNSMVNRHSAKHVAASVGAPASVRHINDVRPRTSRDNIVISEEHTDIVPAPRRSFWQSAKDNWKGLWKLIWVVILLIKSPICPKVKLPQH